MKLSAQMKRRFFLQTVFFAAVYLTIGFAIGCWYAAQSAAGLILMELAK